MLLIMATVKSANKAPVPTKKSSDEVTVRRAQNGFTVHEGGPYMMGDHKPTVHTSIHKAFRHAKGCMAGGAEEAAEGEKE